MLRSTNLQPILLAEDNLQVIKKTNNQRFFGYLLAVIVTLLGFLVKALLIKSISWPEGSLVLSTLTIMISAWYGGFGPGVLSTILNYFILDYFFISPGFFLIHNTLTQNLRIGIFIVEGVLISWLAESLHRARRNVERNMVKIYQSEQFFRSLIENVKDYAIFMVNTKGLIVSWNEGVASISGFQSNDIINKHFSRIFLEEKERDYDNYLRAAKTKGHYEIEGWKKRRDGSRFWTNITITPLRDKNKHLLGYSIILRDLTEKKKIEELKNDFLSIVAHELKTPISVSRIICENILKSYRNLRKPNAELKDLKDMDSELTKLSLLINDVLDLSRIENFKLQLNSKKIELSSLIKAVVSKMIKTTGNQNIIYQKTSKIYLRADPYRIEQVLINLVSNAINYSSTKSKIVITTSILNQKVTVSVKDQGIGISKDQLKLIFNKYYQVNKFPIKGFGLGLYISKKIINIHKGKIWVESSKEQGTILSFSLPIPSEFMNSSSF